MPANNWKHGYAKTTTHNIWCSMKQRCNNPNNIDYLNYGGRGIYYDNRWEDFRNFLQDMGVCPKGYSLERIDVNGNYCKNNCKWIPHNQQSMNRRNTLHITLNGITKSLKEWCDEIGINYNTAYMRIRKLGWTEEQALK